MQNLTNTWRAQAPWVGRNLENPNNKKDTANPIMCPTGKKRKLKCGRVHKG